MEIQSKTFNRISFKWNGKAGAKLMVRFNCLSTDFSRIKGVKGIPLRVHMDTMASGDEQILERSYAKIKLFRDKVSISFGRFLFRLELERISVLTLSTLVSISLFPSPPFFFCRAPRERTKTTRSIWKRCGPK